MLNTSHSALTAECLIIHIARVGYSCGILCMQVYVKYLIMGVRQYYMSVWMYFPNPITYSHAAIKFFNILPF